MSRKLLDFGTVTKGTASEHLVRDEDIKETLTMSKADKTALKADIDAYSAVVLAEIESKK